MVHNFNISRISTHRIAGVLPVRNLNEREKERGCANPWRPRFIELNLVVESGFFWNLMGAHFSSPGLLLFGLFPPKNVGFHRKRFYSTAPWWNGFRKSEYCIRGGKRQSKLCIPVSTGVALYSALIYSLFFLDDDCITVRRGTSVWTHFERNRFRMSPRRGGNRGQVIISTAGS